MKADAIPTTTREEALERRICDLGGEIASVCDGARALALIARNAANEHAQDPEVDGTLLSVAWVASALQAAAYKVLALTDLVEHPTVVEEEAS